jgi:hypothetical protein
MEDFGDIEQTNDISFLVANGLREDEDETKEMNECDD